MYVVGSGGPHFGLSVLFGRSAKVSEVIAEGCRAAGGTHEQASSLNAQWRLHQVPTVKLEVASISQRLDGWLLNTPYGVE